MSLKCLMRWYQPLSRTCFLCAHDQINWTLADPWLTRSVVVFYKTIFPALMIFAVILLKKGLNGTRTLTFAMLVQYYVWNYITFCYTSSLPDFILVIKFCRWKRLFLSLRRFSVKSTHTLNGRSRKYPRWCRMNALKSKVNPYSSSLTSVRLSRWL